MKIDSLLESHASEPDDKKLNLTDSTSALMKSDDNIKPRYNAQVLSNNQIIIAADLVNEENDQGQLQPMVEQMKNNLSFSQAKHFEDVDQKNEGEAQEEKMLVEESDLTVSLSGEPSEPKGASSSTKDSNEKQEIKLTADAGYNAGANLEYLDSQEDIDSYISMNRRDEDQLSEDEKRFLKSSFEYDEDSDELICPDDKRLENYGERINGDKKETIYACRLDDRQMCSNVSKCVTSKEDKKKGYRTVTDDGYLIYRKEMKDKMSQEASQKIYDKRAGAVESIFHPRARVSNEAQQRYYGFCV